MTDSKAFKHFTHPNSAMELISINYKTTAFQLDLESTQYQNEHTNKHTQIQLLGTTQLTQTVNILFSN